LKEVYTEVTMSASVEAEVRDVDLDAQQAARDAVMKVPAFPELQVRLTRVFGPGAERDMVHQLVYWFRKPKMQNRWWAYLTREHWYEQRGLNRKQVDKARRRLKAHESGVVQEKLGPYKRIHYFIDWVALAELLRIPLKGVPMDECETEGFRTPLKGVPKPSDPPLGVSDSSDPHSTGDTPDTYAGNPPTGGVPTNTGKYAGAFPQDNSALQAGAEPAKAEPAPQPINEEPIDLDDLEQPDENKRHSQVGETRHETASARAEVADPKSARKIRSALENPNPELRAVLERYHAGEMDLAGLADAMRHRPYLAGTLAWSQLRTDHVGEALEELGLLERVAVAS
jgi:hypothetical protein